MSVAIAAPNALAAAAGRAVAEAGGNAVDAAIAAVVVAACTEPGVCSLPGGAYITTQPAEGPPEVIDANVTMPGRGLAHIEPGQGTFDIATEYGGGIDITIGHGTVATPGTPAGLALAHARHGTAPWGHVIEPAIAIAEQGFPLSQASHFYLEYVHEDLYGWHPPSYDALHVDGALIDRGGTVRVAGLADSLRQYAQDGADAFAYGDLGARIVADVQANGGLLTRQDLAAYEPIVRAPTVVDLGRWSIATNPPPAIGGVTLAAMLTLLADLDGAVWDAAFIRRMVQVQHAVLGHRVSTLDVAPDRHAAAEQLLRRVADGRFDAGLASPSTVHVSAVGDDGTACAVTASAGYGSGAMPPGTGMWLNNCLGEQELNRHGIHAWQVGERLPSNMAPTVARRDDGATLAIGSPGADRITTAILQTLVRFASGVPLDQAAAAPRLHVRHLPDANVRAVGYERDLDVPALDLPTRAYPPHSMFFGGVTAALLDEDGRLGATADPRRTGATEVST